ncbi:bifunctional helix-turn-helix domain-containing protein/methylated-DNA--[protein]-cysteine S-methyltransferase [Sulfitobacter sp. F26169L]|uniref:bifunctional helix-turn-helix domain-containing protein/methylated-DNA--[protein]-cysteine S-methyltransferase n=1 Tax=Sulfitobacter sp. F26169L TaxID=2996015 RepID=UPI002260D7A0|nr:bifunctional helix-turn-helix domain-containing protein/methylated-DNA--[protein]-cysteine S-methyltransferase [Sulfitobacter sp. F26169L]MCX7566625.1 bifunctional helix-turn-helix domain-containing protein/methylated-DNA--[protein]-cysteine S-methyltransferase [Sulfitobacter sp. F26169L]
MTQMMQNPDRATNTYHYGVIARAIALIDNAETPLGLDALAGEMGMSAAHFQRVFSTWAGVSPKRYQQYLTLGHAKSLLRARFTTLEAAHASGLSGTGRLHDLFVRWEAMSPGDFASGGVGLEIDWGWFDSPFGPVLVMGTQKGICGLSLAAETGKQAAMNDLRSRWPAARYRENPAALEEWVRIAFGQGKEGETAPLYLTGAPFQIKVWEALLRLPEGQVTTYGAIAQAIGSPRAVRAVGTAVGRNPIGYLIPCHRVLRKSGGLGGYHWGLPLKRAMLGYESARRDAE